MRHQNKVVIVTGAGRNIGEETAKLFVKEGARVAVVDLDDRGQGVADNLNAEKEGSAIFIKANVADEESVKNLVAETVKAFGRIDTLVNNVAISDNLTIRECTLADFQKTIDVTLTSQFLTCKYVGEQMIEQGDGGVIVNIGSTSGFKGRNSAVAYCAAKGGVANLVRAIAAQYAEHGIRVNSVVPNRIGSPVGKEEFDPGRYVTNMLHRPGLPEELAAAVNFMASDEASFIYGENLFVDGGYSAMMDGS
jgi:NAD(P)-dependent dehydrogenase (short-subunit alcohol dehydrogenase family)|tara:strand:- start:1207 stop:1956 length:750 start_codon:yes stop_codon:yes gene_type:complete